MSLREEIERIQKSYYVSSYAIKDSVNEIIKEFEKRIDSRLNNYLQKDWNDLYVKGLIEGLSNFKEEMLK